MLHMFPETHSSVPVSVDTNYQNWHVLTALSWTRPDQLLRLSAEQTDRDKSGGGTAHTSCQLFISKAPIIKQMFVGAVNVRPLREFVARVWNADRNCHVKFAHVAKRSVALTCRWVAAVKRGTKVVTSSPPLVLSLLCFWSFSVYWKIQGRYFTRQLSVSASCRLVFPIGSLSLSPTSTTRLRHEVTAKSCQMTWHNV
jgi:hypothetical protein